MENALEKNPSPPMEDDRLTKKARFRARGDDGVNPPPLSFKETLVHDQTCMEEDVMGKSCELEFSDEDVSIFKEGDTHAIVFSQKVHYQLANFWQFSVVVKLLGRPITYRTLCSRLELIWGNTEGFTVVDMENNFFLVKFKNSLDYEFALTQGPWIILGNYLTVQPWKPEFASSDPKIRSVVAWIRLPGMCLHYYHKGILRLIGQMIGKVLRIDYKTESAARGQFARIAVEVDLEKPLCSKVIIDGKKQLVEYESLPKICFHCGVYGHFSSDCPLVAKIVVDGNVTPPANAVNGDGVDSDQRLSKLGADKENSDPNYGPLMIAKRRGFKSRNFRNSETTGEACKESRIKEGEGSRFDVLSRILRGDNGNEVQEPSEENLKKNNHSNNSALESRKSIVTIRNLDGSTSRSKTNVKPGQKETMQTHASHDSSKVLSNDKLANLKESSKNLSSSLSFYNV